MTTSILSIKGVGPAAAKTLGEHGFATADDVAAATAEQLGKVPGFSVARVERILAEAIAATGLEQPPTAIVDEAQNPEQDQEPESGDSPEKKDEGKKAKKGKNKKGKKKGKKKKGKKKDKKKDKKKGKKKK